MMLQDEPIGFSSNGNMTPLRKRVTCPLDAETQMEIQSAAFVMAAAAEWRVPYPEGKLS